MTLLGNYCKYPWRAHHATRLWICWIYDHFPDWCGNNPRLMWKQIFKLWAACCKNVSDTNICQIEKLSSYGGTVNTANAMKFATLVLNHR